MMRIAKQQWDKNRGRLRATLSEDSALSDRDYDSLVKRAFGVIFNSDAIEGGVYDGSMMPELDLAHITVVDNGTYQASRLFVIPFLGYDLNECDYLLTYIDYGTCSGCDALLAAEALYTSDKEKGITAYMSICKDLITNAVRPFNRGWAYDEKYDLAENDEKQEDCW